MITSPCHGFQPRKPQNTCNCPTLYFSFCFKFDNYYGYTQNTLPGWVHLQSDAVISMNATDYLEVYAYIDHRWTAYQNYIAGNQASYFSAFKLIGS